MFSFLQISHVPILLELLQLCQEAAAWVIHGESTEVPPDVYCKQQKGSKARHNQKSSVFVNNKIDSPQTV